MSLPRFTAVLLFLSTLLLGASLFVVVPRIHWLQELNSHFSLPYAAANVGIALLWFLNSRKERLLLSLSLLVIHAAFGVVLGRQFVEFLGGASRQHSSPPLDAIPFRVTYLDVRGLPPADIEPLVARVEPRLLLIRGVLPEGIQPLGDSLEGISVSSAYGDLSIFSSDRFSAAARTDFGEGMPPSIVVPLRIKGRELEVSFLAVPPIGTQESLFRARVLQRRIAMGIRHSPANRIVIGDFGSPVGGLLYRGFKSIGRVDDAAAINGGYDLFHLNVFDTRYRTLHVFVHGSVEAGLMRYLPAGAAGITIDFKI